MLEVHLGVVGFFSVDAKWLLVVAYALLDLLAAVVVVTKGKDRMRTGSSLLFTRVGMVGVQPPREVLFLLRFDGSLRPSMPDLLLAIVIERLRPGRKSHVMRMYFFGLDPMPKLVRSCRIIGGLRGDTAICNGGISILTLKNGLILLLLHPVSSRKNAVPILGVS